MEIDLEKLPRRLVASAENARDYTFYIVKPKPSYTPQAFEANPNCVAAADLFLKLGPIPDRNGEAAAEITAANARSIQEKLTGAEEEARAVVLATSKPTNAHPDKKLAIVESVKIKGGPAIKLTGLRTSVGAAQWVCYHHPILFVQVEIVGPQRAVIADIEPKRQPVAMFACWEQAAPGSHAVKRLVLGAAGDGHGPNPRCDIPASFHRNGWWSGVPGWDRGVVNVPVSPGGRYVFAVYPRYAGQFTLTVKGTGEFAKLSEKILLTMNGAHPHPGD